MSPGAGCRLATWSPGAAPSDHQLVVGAQLLVDGRRPAVTGQQVGACVPGRRRDESVVGAASRTIGASSPGARPPQTAASLRTELGLERTRSPIDVGPHRW